MMYSNMYNLIACEIICMIPNIMCKIGKKTIQYYRVNEMYCGKMKYHNFHVISYNMISNAIKHNIPQCNIGQYNMIG